VSASIPRRASRRRAVSGPRPRRLRRLALDLQPLESRQLLSIAQGGYAASPVASGIVAQPAAAVSASFFSTEPTGLSSSQIRTAYGVNQISLGSVSGDGAGQTIAIVDGYFDPSISSDLARFDSEYGLPAPPSFKQYVENGMFFSDSGWALETALDVEWAHAVAPAANIVLVEAQPTLNDLMSAVSFARQLPGVSVVSMSWGTGEFAGETTYDSVFTTPAGHNGVTFVASSGDSGTTEYPSASPNVLSVGGTTLNVSASGAYGSETGWTGTGTGSSPYESAPAWQAAATSAAGLKAGSRTTPDVAWDASPSTGVSAYSSVPYFGQSGWFTVGGTSVGAPSWAGLIAIADQGLAQKGVGSLSNAQASLYRASSSDFNHPASGSTGSSSTAAYSLVTGLGSPKANLVVPALVQINTPTSAPATKSTPAPAKSSSQAATRLDLVPPSQTSPTSTATSSTSSTSSSSNASSVSSISITALNPSSTSSSSSPSLTPIILVPAPLPPAAIHLGASVSPVTAQAIFSPLAISEEQPTSITHFGQSNQTELEPVMEPQLGPRTEAQPFIDAVEPFQPGGPGGARSGDPAAVPAGSRAWRLRPFSISSIDAALALSDSTMRPGPRGGSPASAKEGWSDPTLPWGFSTLFGAAVVAAGGYHLVLRRGDRSNDPGVKSWVAVNPSARKRPEFSFRRAR
jgi:hypothetical protein